MWDTVVLTKKKVHQNGQNSRFFIFKVYRYIYFRQINIKLWFGTRCKMTIDLLMARTIAKYFAMLVKKKRKKKA
jgi:hypothetical protein